jgi:hypothetical protein
MLRFMRNSGTSLATRVIPQSQCWRELSTNSPGPVCSQTRHAPETTAETPTLWLLLLPIGAAALLSLAACANQSGAISLEGKPLSGYVRMTQVQAAYLGSGNAGSGVLRYQGNSYPFTVAGLGVGGIGVSKIEAKGDVYGLKRLGDFAGAYAQGRYGFAVGNTSAGDLWLQNRKGVIMHLNAKRQGLMLSLGGDAVVIEMNQ